MNVKTILGIFSTRELALLIWATLALIAMLFSKSIRQPLGEFFKLLFGKKISPILLMLMVYVTSLILLLYKLNVWDILLLKDTVFWFFSVALVFLFTINKAKNIHFFKDILMKSFKWSIVLEFIINFYTFSLLTEIILMPVIFFLALTQAFSKTDKKFEKIDKLLVNFFTIIGITFFVTAFYKTFKNYQDVLSIHNLFSLLLPPILTVLLIPFLYLLAMYMNYDDLFTRVNFMTDNNEKKQLLKKQILLVANLNLNRLMAITKKMNKFDVYDCDNLKSYLRALTK